MASFSNVTKCASALQAPHFVKKEVFNQLKSQTEKHYCFLILWRIQRKDLTESCCDPPPTTLPSQELSRRGFRASTNPIQANQQDRMGLEVYTGNGVGGGSNEVL